MEYVPLGRTDLLVSRIALGCMGFADPAHGVNPWALDEQAAAPIFRRAVELGITLWDTANVYSGGTSEEIVGRAVKKYSRREDVVIAIKVGLPMHDGPGGSGLSRKRSRSGRRLARAPRHGLHRPLPDPPVRPGNSGRRNDGSPPRDGGGRKGPVHRRLVDVGVAVRQDAAHRHAARPHEVRVDAEPVQPRAARGRAGDVPPARRPGHLQPAMVPPCQGAFGTALRTGDRPLGEGSHRTVVSNPTVAAPVIGATSPAHLDDAVAALAVQLDETEIDDLESRYTPRQPTGF
jgi:1-deoxyxylulose-5-phosphate synthase